MPDEPVPDLTIIIPVYNEAQSLPELQRALRASLEAISLAAEIIYVDDSSEDTSFEAIREICQADARARGLQLRRHCGKSAALTAGFDLMQGRLVATLDADLQDDPAELPGLLAALDQGYNMVCGWRKERADPWSKRLASRVFNGVLAAVSGLRLHDMNTGLKVFDAQVAREVRLYGELHRYLPLLAAQHGFRVGEVPVRHRPRRYGRSKYGGLRYLSGALDLLTVTFLLHYRLRPLHLFSLPGLALALAGGLICAWLAWERLFMGQFLSNRPLLTLGVLLLILGIQFFALGLLGEALAAAHSDQWRAPVRHDTRKP